MNDRINRRSLIGAGLMATALAAAPARAVATRRLADVVQEGLERHGEQVPHDDIVGIADFAHPSRSPRFWIVDRLSGRASAYLVAHGSGSDPAHSGWLQRFSNEPGSNASSSGGYRTAAPYVGKHGRSQRLVGLEPGNSNAEARAIVMHGAWYVSDAMARQHGKIGRSQGCFAFSDDSLEEVMQRLAPGRLLYAGRFGIAA